MAELAGWGMLHHHGHTPVVGSQDTEKEHMYPGIPTDVIASSSREQSHAEPGSSLVSADSGSLSGQPGPGAVDLPPEVIRAFLQQQQHHQPADPGDLDSEFDGPSVSANPLPGGLSSATSPTPGAQHRQQPAPSKAASGKQQQPKKKRSFFRRLLKALLLTSGGLALVGGGVVAGVALYKNYMETLDDRAQLAARVTQLKKAEEKLQSKYHALEQEKEKLQKSVSDSTAAVAAAEHVSANLSSKLTAATSERDEALRFNLNWQRKFGELETKYEAAHAERLEALQAADKLRSENSKLAKEVKKLMASLESLEGKYGQLESTVLQLKTRL